MGKLRQENPAQNLSVATRMIFNLSLKRRCEAQQNTMMRPRTPSVKRDPGPREAGRHRKSGSAIKSSVEAKPEFDSSHETEDRFGISVARILVDSVHKGIHFKYQPPSHNQALMAQYVGRRVSFCREMVSRLSFFRANRISPLGTRDSGSGQEWKREPIGPVASVAGDLRRGGSSFPRKGTGRPQRLSTEELAIQHASKASA
jgi:hypothetical protein